VVLTNGKNVFQCIFLSFQAKPTAKHKSSVQPAHIWRIMVHVYMSVACTTNCNMNTLLAFSEIRFVARTLPKHIYITIGTNPTGSALHLHQYCHTRIPFSSFSNYITSLRMFFEVVDEILPISNHYDLQVLYGSNQNSLLRWKNFLYEKFVKTTDANRSFKDSSVFQFLYGFRLPSPSVSTTHQIQIASSSISSTNHGQFPGPILFSENI